MSSSKAAPVRAPATTLEGQKQQAQEYLDKHGLLPLLQGITASLLNERPESPKDFILKALEQARAAKAKGQNIVPYTRENLAALFSILDVTGKGSITLAQYASAMSSIGAGKANPKPSATAEGRVSKDTFLEEALVALRKL